MAKGMIELCNMYINKCTPFTTSPTDCMKLGSYYSIFCSLYCKQDCIIVLHPWYGGTVPVSTLLPYLVTIATKAGQGASCL